MIIETLKRVVDQNRHSRPLYLRNLLKESLQFYVLNFIYGSKWGENLLFTGGSCLRMFWELPCLSEDLDFNVQDSTSFTSQDLAADLTDYFRKTWQYRDFTIKTSARENTLYLKFPVLDELGLVRPESATKVLFLRVDLAPAVGEKFTVELSLKSTADFSFIVRRYSLPDLFAGKAATLLQRTTREGEEIKPRVKGRDYFDLLWFLENKVALNLPYLQELMAIGGRSELEERLRQKVKELDLKVFRDDLQPLFADQNFVADLAANYKELVGGLLGQIAAVG